MGLVERGDCAGKIVIVSYDIVTKFVDEGKVKPGQYKVRKRWQETAL